MTFNIKGNQVRIYKSDMLVIAVTILKLLLMGFFSSDYQNELFIPFTLFFVENGGNPYQHFYDIGMLNVFPYPAFMLFMQSIGIIIIKIFGISSIFMTNLIFKMPSLFIDVVGLHFISKMFPDKRKYAAVFYYVSPVSLYAVYMHGQLDLIPTVLLLCSVYYLSSKDKRRYFKGGVLLSCALLSKMHILAVLPIIFIYLYKRDGIRAAIKFGGCVIIAVLVGMMPFMSEGFRTIVLFNSEQSILTQVILKFSTVDIYIPILAVLIVYLMAFGINIINRDLFVSLCGVVFAVFLALCPPMPGWYVWIIPYVTLFFMSIDEGKYKNILVYVLLNGLYLVYFIFLHNRNVVDLYVLNVDMSFLKIHSSILANLFFTLLAGTLIYIIFAMYHLGVTSSSLYKRRNLPFTIGVAGDSGAGKSTFIDMLVSVLGESNLLFIEGDGDHRWVRGDKYWEEYTHLNPKANFLYRQAHDLKQLRQGVTVKRVEYDHDTGRFTSARKIRPRKYIVLCGLHSLYLPQARKNLDLKIYMDVDETLRRYWQIQRDTSHRGYSKEKILKQIEDRIPDAVKYIHPQKNYADIIIQYYDKTLVDCMEDDHKLKMSVRITMSAAIDIETMVNVLVGYGVYVVYDYSEDLQMQIVDLDADELENIKIPIEALDKIIPQLEEITRECFNEMNGVDGVLELFMLLLISSKMRGEIE